MRMNKMKSLYEAPTTDVLVVRFEDSILQVLSPVQVIGLTTLGGGDQGFGDSAASIEDKSSESWW